MAPRRNKKRPCCVSRRSRRIRGKSPLPFGPCNLPRRHNMKTCPACGRRGKVAKKNGRRRRKANSYFHLFFKHVCQRMKEKNVKKSGRCLMIKAGECWRALTPEQKKDFIEKVSKGGDCDNFTTSTVEPGTSSGGTQTGSDGTQTAPPASQHTSHSHCSGSGFSFP